MADWRVRAACIGLDPELFFPEDKGMTPEARVACAVCPVWRQCLAHAATSEDWLWGIRGGLSEAERAKMPRPREPVSA